MCARVYTAAAYVHFIPDEVCSAVGGLIDARQVSQQLPDQRSGHQVTSFSEQLSKEGEAACCCGNSTCSKLCFMARMVTVDSSTGDNTFTLRQDGMFEVVEVE